ncbi:response regulator [Aromatoleum diolicum]|uniref:Response regulator n=1 Tax=Aromatoleum diolicum TaxID=75796 RepID=A0ABX1QGD0_9RHOO|nr:response regulator [Aromatoleum diolicum]NMG76046.1 response regulator [Aromatoleum diolicum]
MKRDGLKNILYVEDEPDIRLIATMALESLGGFTLEVCESGVEALAKATAFGPDLLLLDVMMPGMDGPTTLQALRKLPGLDTVPAVFMTAKVQPQEIAEYHRLGALDVIAKPFDPMTLAAAVEAIWQRSVRE